MSMCWRVRPLLLATAAALAAAPGIGFGQPATPPEPIRVVLSEYDFSPARLVAPTGTVRLSLVNEGNRIHNLVILIDGIERESQMISPGDAVAWELAVDRPATYQFWCGMYRHLEKGMAGTLIAS